MTRKEFYIEYYRVTDRVFRNQKPWRRRDDQDPLLRPRGHLNDSYPSKSGRILLIIAQYLTLPLFCIPLCIDLRFALYIPVALLIVACCLGLTNFSIIKIELLYSVYRKNNVYCSLLHDIFLNTSTDFMETLRRSTKKAVTGYYFCGISKIPGKYCGICRKSENKLLLTFRKNKVVIKVNEKKIVIHKEFATKEQLISEIAAVINTSI
ncbi:MAG: hypothetical protein IJW70_02250 [Clostridia bacterium]|nr:hypothetical protein [Clostridia bacterium]